MSDFEEQRLILSGKDLQGVDSLLAAIRSELRTLRELGDDPDDTKNKTVVACTGLAGGQLEIAYYSHAVSSDPEADFRAFHPGENTPVADT